MIVKVCQFKARQEHGERLVEIFHPGEGGMEKAAAFFSMNKSAAPMLPQVQSYLEKLQPSPTKIYVLVNALGAGEYWGSNINGDWFPEASLIHEGPVYGYETFYQAYPYKHHVNKDPSKSFGKVVLSCWNDAMKRVELIVEIDREKARQFGAEDVCDRLDKGMFPDVSMGCKVPYDLCSKCLDWEKYRKAQSTFDPSRHRTVGAAVLEFHKRNPIRGLSVTRNDYCVHLKTMLNKILEDGTKIYAINDYPRFFDISFVFIGADKTAKVMAKLAFADMGNVVVPAWMVAEQMGYRQPDVYKGFEKVAETDAPGPPPGPPERSNMEPERTPENERALVDLFQAHRPEVTPAGIAMGLDKVRAKLREKKAAQLKGAEIIKDVVPSQFAGKVLPARPDIPTDILDELGKGSLSEALSTPTTMGMILKPREFQRITIIRMGKKPLADELDRDGLTFPPVEESDRSIPMGSGHFSSVLKRLLLPLMEDRSLLEPVARRRVVRITICGKPEESEDDLKDAEETPFLQKISAAYNGYLDRLDSCLEDVELVVGSNSDLWEAVHRAGLADGFEKSAAGGVSPGVLIGAIGAGYGLSQWAGYQQRRAMMGARGPTGALTNFVAEHPRVVMTAAGLGALHQQGSSIPTSLARGVAATLQGTIQGASKALG
jgi:hypothetical protein